MYLSSRPETSQLQHDHQAVTVNDVERGEKPHHLPEWIGSGILFGVENIMFIKDLNGGVILENCLFFSKQIFVIDIWWWVVMT